MRGKADSKAGPRADDEAAVAGAAETTAIDAQHWSEPGPQGGERRASAGPKSASTLGSDSTVTSGAGAGDNAAGQQQQSTACRGGQLKDTARTGSRSNRSDPAADKASQPPVVLTSHALVGGVTKIVVVDNGPSPHGPQQQPAIAVARRVPHIGISGGRPGSDAQPGSPPASNNNHEPGQALGRRKASDDSGTTPPTPSVRGVVSAGTVNASSSSGGAALGSEVARPVKKRRVDSADQSPATGSPDRELHKDGSPGPGQGREVQQITTRIVIASKPQQEPPGEGQQQQQRADSGCQPEPVCQSPQLDAQLAAAGLGLSNGTEQVVQAMLLLQRMNTSPPSQQQQQQPSASMQLPESGKQAPPTAAPAPVGTGQQQRRRFTVETGGPTSRSPFAQQQDQRPARNDPAIPTVPVMPAMPFITVVSEPAKPGAPPALTSSALASLPSHAQVLAGMGTQHLGGAGATRQQLTQMQALQLAMLFGSNPTLMAAVAAQSFAASAAQGSQAAVSESGGGAAHPTEDAAKIDRKGSLPVQSACPPARGESGSLDAGPPVAEDFGTVVWTGKVKHRHGDSTVELFCMTCLLPERFQEQFPPTMFVSDLAPRAGTKLGPHYPVQCRLDFLSDRQLKKLERLATMNLVADCRLQHCRLVLVPLREARAGGEPALVVKGYLVEA